VSNPESNSFSGEVIDVNDLPAGEVARALMGTVAHPAPGATVGRLRNAICLLAIACAHFAACAQQAWPFACDKTDNECITRTLRAHPAHRFADWQPMFEKPLIERIGPAPAKVVDYLTLDNIVNGWNERPRATQAPASFIAEVKAALADLPPEVNLLFVDRLAGIFLVDDLGGTGFTDIIEDASGEQVAGYIVLDANVLAGRTANDWATWKESTPFSPEVGWQLAARIERDAQDSRRNAIQYILLHELGHVLSIGGREHPPWTIQPKEVEHADAYPFFNLSWQVDAKANRYESLFDSAFASRTSVAYYSGAKLRMSQAPDVYGELARTNFPSLYAATKPGDDFAESFASYVHVVLMKRPWDITIAHDGKVVTNFGACWDEPRCADKRRAMEAILKSP
jgi:hypothetical protein